MHAYENWRAMEIKHQACLTPAHRSEETRRPVGLVGSGFDDGRMAMSRRQRSFVGQILRLGRFHVAALGLLRVLRAHGEDVRRLQPLVCKLSFQD